MYTINSHTSTLVLIDYQTRLMPAIHQAQRVLNNTLLLTQAASTLNIPILATEQNPTALGHNVKPIKTASHQTLTKTHFNACNDGLLEALENTKKPSTHIIIAGCEAHVCMMQTALGLLQANKRVWVVANASGSRRPEDHATAITRLTHAGATIVTPEMVLFEWLESYTHPHFRHILKLIKATE